MNRRNFLSATGAAAAATPLAAAEEAANEYIEMRFYSLHNDPSNQRRRLAAFLKDVHLPMAKRHGLGPVGYFQVYLGPDTPKYVTLTVWKSLADIERVRQELLDDKEYQKAVTEVAAESPVFDRVQSWLMRSFDGMKKLEVPPVVEGKKPRFFDLRIYESYSFHKHELKVDMFNSGGEIDIFRRTGLNPVFFGQTVFGAKMPNLTYMVCYDDWAAREAAWAKFRADPDWKRISKEPRWAGTVSNITNTHLLPEPFSPIR